MDIEESTQRYEAWLQRLIPVVLPDLAYKHQRMKEGAFSFFRATFYRWSQNWEKLAPTLAKTPKVLSVGDLHVENFGTWRDSEGRLAWGVNDFDEAIPLPFTHDLIRLSVSAFLAADSMDHKNRFPSRSEIVQHILVGYLESLEIGGEPIILAERHGFLLKQAHAQTRAPKEYWPRLKERLQPVPKDFPETAMKVLQKSFPKDIEPEYHVLTKPKGLGSLGRRRYVATAQWNGGIIAREIKDTLPSAVVWATNQATEEGNRWLLHTVQSAVRAPDPYYEVRRNWLVRRLAPDCSRIELAELGDPTEVGKLLNAMGHETANIHLGSPQGRKTIRAVWRKLPTDWLLKGATDLYEKTLKDFAEFQEVTISDKATTHTN